MYVRLNDGRVSFDAKVSIGLSGNRFVDLPVQQMSAAGYLQGKMIFRPELGKDYKTSDQTVYGMSQADVRNGFAFEKQSDIWVAAIHRYQHGSFRSTEGKMRERDRKTYRRLMTCKKSGAVHLEVEPVVSIDLFLQALQQQRHSVQCVPG